MSEVQLARNAAFQDNVGNTRFCPPSSPLPSSPLNTWIEYDAFLVWVKSMKYIILTTLFRLFLFYFSLLLDCCRITIYQIFQTTLLPKILKFNICTYCNRIVVAGDQQGSPHTWSGRWSAACVEEGKNSIKILPSTSTKNAKNVITTSFPAERGDGKKCKTFGTRLRLFTRSL